MSTVDAHRATATVQPVGVVLDVQNATVKLDEGWAPYAQVQLVCALPDAADREALDMRVNSLRVAVTVQQDFGAAWSLDTLTDAPAHTVAQLTSLLGGRPLGYLTNLYFRSWNGPSVRPSKRRTFDLFVTEREFDDNAGTLTLQAQSDEARVMGDALIDTVPLDPGTTSLRSICSLVLARYGARLAAGASDAVVAQQTSTIWKPGVKAWAYLTPMLEAAGLRLWCDEKRVWHLDPRQSTIDGSLSISPTDTMVNHRDRMTLNSDVWYDAVVVHYTWTDQYGLTTEAYDVAGAQPAESVLVIDRPAVYPGPGAAAGILARGQGRGRVLGVRAVSNYDATPGMAATILPPDTASQTGYVAAVAFELPAAEMDVTTRGLIDTPETSWLYAPAGVSWLDIPAGVSWLDYEPIGA